ncbi:MAG: MBL fold metallo-hydrolase [Dehalococcoidales bacterium]|nr:MBL fold metallo-hydrolase [Dehalococcoidales bacterium]
MVYAILILMEISWLGHSCFRIKGSRATVITDPYSPDLGYSLGKPAARIVTVSHQHNGHSYVQGVTGEVKAVHGPGEYEISGVMIIGVPTFHDAEDGKVRGKNTVYVMDIDEVSVCHLGDLGHVLTTEQIAEIGNVDVLLLPVGGLSTINAPLAAKVVRQLEPKAVVPMHYKTAEVSWELDPVDNFLKEIGVVAINSQPKLSLTKANLPLTTQVFLLDH